MDRGIGRLGAPGPGKGTMYRNRHEFAEDVLWGPDAETTATIKLSYARLFTPKRIRKFAATFRLNGRDTEALIMTIKGIPDTKAGKALGLSPHTVRVHRSHMYAKIGVTSAERAVLKFVLASGICLDDEDMQLMANQVETGHRFATEDDDG